MRKKKKDKPQLTKEERRAIRLDKGRAWLIRDNNLNKRHLLSRYRKYMRLDLTVAMRDLEELGALYNGGDEKAFQIAREYLMHDVKMAPYEMYMENSDDNFSYIAGYTPGGFPYGVSWQEVGIDPNLPYDEKIRQYAAQTEKEFISSDDLPF